MRADEPEAATDAGTMAAEVQSAPRHGLDRLFVKGMPFYARHGVYEAERELGQRFVVDCDCRLDTRPAAWADDEALTISYQKIYEQVRAVVEDDLVHLIETLAERIATRLLDHFPLLDEVVVTVHKPNAPVSGVFADVGVEITRRR